jgi:hypothetical protein
MYNKDVTYLPFGRILLKPMDAFQPVLDEFSPGHLLQHRQLRRQPRGIRLHVVQQLVGIGRQLHHLGQKVNLVHWVRLHRRPDFEQLFAVVLQGTGIFRQRPFQQDFLFVLRLFPQHLLAPHALFLRRLLVQHQHRLSLLLPQPHQLHLQRFDLGQVALFHRLRVEIPNIPNVADIIQ